MAARDWPGPDGTANRLAIRLRTHLEGDFRGVAATHGVNRA